MSIHLEQTVSEGGFACVVCGLPMADIRAGFTEEYHGQLLAFDRQECLKDFLEDPERYVPSQPPK